MASKICKIVYFDEDSVTDYVQIVAGGTLEKTTELLNSSDLSEEQKADMQAVFDGFKALGYLDYVACWFWKGAQYIQQSNHLLF